MGDLPRLLFYAGIGSRRTPTDVLHLFKRTARGLSQAEWILRSGGAVGADQAFQAGADTRLQQILRFTEDAKAMEIARAHHPAWDKCSEHARGLLARNAQIILGPDLNEPVRFVICWTDAVDGRGGTNHACRIAFTYGIPVINVWRPDHG